MHFNRRLKLLVLIFIPLISFSASAFVGGGGGHGGGGHSSSHSSGYGGGARSYSDHQPSEYTLSDMIIYSLCFLAICIHLFRQKNFSDKKVDYSSLQERNYYINRCKFSKVIPSHNHSYTEFLDRANFLNKFASDNQSKSKLLSHKFISKQEMNRVILSYFSSLQEAWCSKNKLKIFKLCSLRYCFGILFPQLIIMKKYKVSNIISDTKIEDLILINCTYEPIKRSYQLIFVVTGSQIDEYVLQENLDKGQFNSKPFNCILTVVVKRNSLKIKSLDISKHVYDDIAARYFRAQKET